MMSEIELSATVHPSAEVEAKMEDQLVVENKAEKPKVDKRVRIKIRPRRAVNGVGGPGDEVLVSKEVADRLIAIGYADKL